MSTRIAEQRNAYKGSPPRPWVRLRFVAPDGTISEMELLADTGNPCAIIISQAAMTKLKHREAPNVNTNFGPLDGGWISIDMPELGLKYSLLGYGSDDVVSATKISNPHFDGLVGLPLLRLGEYGGNATAFWFRSVQGQP